MKAIYVGNSKRSKGKGGSNWKLYLFLVFFLALTGSILKITAPTLVEGWINRKGAVNPGYAFSIRDVDFSFGQGLMILKDVKVFNPDTTTELLEAPNLTVHLNWQDLILSQNKKVSLKADKVDLFISEDFIAEMERVKAAEKKHEEMLYLESIEGQIAQLNIIEQKTDQSRRIVALNDVTLKVKDLTPLSINKNTEFSLTSKIADGGKLDLKGKTRAENGKTPWSIEGSLKQVPPEILNKIAGDKLPFSFFESSLNAQISAHSENGKVRGEIAPDVQRLNLLEERPGFPANSIARALNEDLTFSLPFTLKDELTVQYADTYKRLKSYRRYPTSTESSRSTAEPVSQAAKSRDSSSI